MRAEIASHPPATYELHPERESSRSGVLDSAARLLAGGIVRPLRARSRGLRQIVSQVEECEPGLSGRTDAALLEVAEGLRFQLRREGFETGGVARAFALVREVAERTVDMRHFDCQLVGGWALLQGMVAEMETGEGKTLTATLTACTAALAGVPVHVITVNDYLTARDAEWMGPIYRALGLTVGYIVHDRDQETRRLAYQCDITYCTNKEIVFDYLRDRMTLGDRVDPLRLQSEYLFGRDARVRRLLLRGLHFGIVDEADSVLIDEARTPLILSGKGGGEEEGEFAEQGLELADGLEERTDYRIDLRERKSELTERGKEQVRAQSEGLGPWWRGTIRREEKICQALSARHLFHRDEHYLVREGKVEIVDEFTGRVMADRSWERGLHQLIELKEGCEMTLQHETLARISYQRFFRRYLRLSGMTGTAREVGGELWSVYGLPVVHIPTNRPLRRSGRPDRIFPAVAAKWLAVVERVRQLHRENHPVLVGTRSVAASEYLSSLLEEERLDHQVLNAKFDSEEAGIIARAGEAGRITIATNMAGRGTDIVLGPGVADRDGLHVILTERHEAPRIDRQLAGRCGRQGDPGTHEAFLSLEDPLLQGGRGGLPAWVAQRLSLRPASLLWRWLAGRAIARAQRKLQRLHWRIRRDLLKYDEQREEMLSFSGRVE